MASECSSPRYDDKREYTTQQTKKKHSIDISFVFQDFGFCWGVERSIALAYEAVRHFPNRKIHITNELIHNPEVNDKLQEMNVNFIEKLGEGKKNFETVGEGDVVILPAFGASLEEMKYFDEKVRDDM